MQNAEKLNVFVDLVRMQFTYGGKKYAHNEEKESTDVLFNTYGRNWLFGTIDKYTFRYKNLARERDLLKIACYQYIIWLKRGFFVMRCGINSPPIETTVKIKEEQFNNFLELALGKFIRFEETIGHPDYISAISNILSGFARKTWNQVEEDELFKIFFLAWKEWKEKYSDAVEHDTDCYHPADGK